VARAAVERESGVAAAKAAPAGLSSADALAVQSSALAQIARPKASHNTRFIASFPAAGIIVEELGRRVNSQ